MVLPEKYRFGVDLVEQTFYHLEFLKAVNSNKELSKLGVLKFALYRYEKFWLPLAAEHPSDCLSAPMDIEWVWHCHMLSPKAYEMDCHNIVQRTVNHTLYPPDAFQKARNTAYAYWTQKYREPFYIDYSAISPVDTDVNFTSSISYDILAAADRQTTFFYQVSLPHYKDRKFIECALERYMKFLYLRKKYPQEFLVPCYDIDIIWHTHQLNPVVYKQDTVRITGSLFSHDDSVNDRKPGSKLSNADKRTRELWNQIFHESFSKCGSMYRGKPPYNKLCTMTRNEEFACFTKSCTVSIELLRLDMSNKDLNIKKHFNLVISTAGDSNTEIIRRFILKLPAHNRPGGGKTQEWSKIGSFDLNTRKEHGLMFIIQHKTGVFGSKEETDSAYLDLLPLIESTAGVSKIGGRIKSRLTFQSNATLDIEFYIQNLRLRSASLHLVEGLYKKDILPDDVQKLLGPVTLETIPPWNDKKCRTATHSLKNHLGIRTFKVQMVHSASLMTSVIQVFYESKMCALAHLIAADQLPLLSEVGPATVPLTLNPKGGERAVIIKNISGDWGLLFGQWTGIKKGVGGTADRRGVPGICGTLTFTFYKMSTGSCIQTNLLYPLKVYTVSIGSSKSDLMAGVIEIDPSSHEVAEHIALAFAISLLHVLCVPRLKDWPEGAPVSISYKRGAKMVEPVPSDLMKFIKAAGLNVETPSNCYINQCSGQLWAILGGRGFPSDQVYIENSAEWQGLPGGFGSEYSGDAGCGGCGGGWGRGRSVFMGGAGCTGGDSGGCGGGGCGGGGCGGGGCGGGG